MGRRSKARVSGEKGAVTTTSPAFTETDMKTILATTFLAFATLTVACGDQDVDSRSRSSELGAEGDAPKGDAPDASPPDVSPDTAPDASPPDGACTPLPAPGGSANPAAVYCAALGYTVDGSDCAFADGQRCEQWAFYRGECHPERSFCNLHGGSLANVLEDMGTWTASYGKCTLADGRSCPESDFSQACGCK